MMSAKYPDIDVRIAGRGDAAALMEIGAATFYETFAMSNSPQDMSMYLAEHYHLAKVDKELNDPDNMFLACYSEDKMVAYAKLGFGSVEQDLDPLTTLEIERIYVRKLHQGKGFGNALMHYIFEEARRRLYHTVWLGVWEKNLPAIAFYEQWGFEVFGSKVFMLGLDRQNDYLMKKTIATDKHAG